MRQYRITLEDHTFDVRVLDDPRRERVRVEVDGEIFTVGVATTPAAAEVAAAASGPATAPAPRPPRFRKTSEVSEVSGTPGNTIAAPLPGVIKSIAVHPGQQVAGQDELLVIEAMKMDNVIRAPRSGTISTVHITEGRQVAYGEPLVEMSNEQ